MPSVGFLKNTLQIHYKFTDAACQMKLRPAAKNTQAALPLTHHAISRGRQRV
jgi:hypothetical protein